MMYCGNCVETADESKSKSRQIACERVNTLNNAMNAVKRPGSWSTSTKGAERKREREIGKCLTRKQNIIKTKRGEVLQHLKGTLIIEAHRCTENVKAMHFKGSFSQMIS